MSIKRTLEEALEHHNAGRLDAAEARYRRVLKKAPRSADTLRLLGILMRQKGAPQKAASCFRKALELAGGSLELHSGLAGALIDGGDGPGALAVLDAALVETPGNMELLLAKGGALTTLGQLEEAETLYLAAIAAAPTSAAAHNGLGDVLRVRGDFVGAVRAYGAATAYAPDDEEGKQNLQRVLGSSAKPWHFPMMNDVTRNAAYDAAIRRAVQPEDLVLDIGSGSGLLSMMAARAGAAQVVGVEVDRLAYHASNTIVRKNQLSDTIRMLPKRSTALEIGADLARKADLLICEVFDVSVVGEDALRTIQDARRRLLAPGGRVLPMGVRVMAAPVRSQQLRDRFEVGEVSGFDLSSFNFLAERRVFQLDLDTFDYELLAEPFCAVAFDFTEDFELHGDAPQTIPIHTSGPVDGFIMWQELQLDAETVLSTAPGASPTHWQQAFLPQWEPLRVATGQQLDVTTRWRRYLLWIDV